VDQAVGGAVVALFVVFLGALRATLRAREGEAGALSATATIAGSVVAAGVLVDVGRDMREVSEVLAFPAVALVLAATAAILSTAALPRWVAFAGVATAALLLPAGVAVGNDVAFAVAAAAFVAWVAATTLAMLRRRGD
jgi:hypothetical protein